MILLNGFNSHIPWAILYSEAGWEVMLAGIPEHAEILFALPLSLRKLDAIMKHIVVNIGVTPVLPVPPFVGAEGRL